MWFKMANELSHFIELSRFTTKESTMPDLAKKREELTEKRNELAARLNAINLDFRQGLDRDMEEQAQQLENQEVLAEIARITAEELNKVEAALGRIESALRS